MPPKRDHRSGPHKRYEPISIEEINAHPSVLFNFHEVGCLDFCQRIEEVKSFSPLTHLCALRFKDKHFQLAGLDFKISPRYVSKVEGLFLISAEVAYSKKHCYILFKTTLSNLSKQSSD